MKIPLDKILLIDDNVNDKPVCVICQSLHSYIASLHETGLKPTALQVVSAAVKRLKAKIIKFSNHSLAEWIILRR